MKRTVSDPVVFGGVDRRDRALADTWALELETGTWTDLQPAVTPPARFYSAATHDPVRDRVVLFGGGPDRDHFRADTWLYDPVANAWSEVR